MFESIVNGNNVNIYIYKGIIHTLRNLVFTSIFPFINVIFTTTVNEVSLSAKRITSLLLKCMAHPHAKCNAIFRAILEAKNHVILTSALLHGGRTKSLMQ